MKCFYHADADGRCAGFWVCLNVGITDTYKPEFIEINYGKPFPFERIGQDEQVYIVDYSIEPAEMLQLLEITKDITWIDHHKTAIEKYADFPHAIRGVRYDGVAGCMLAYCYIHHMTDRGVGEVGKFLVEKYGFTPDEIANRMDARMMRMVSDAMQFANGKDTLKTKKVPDNVPKFRTPGQQNANRRDHKPGYR